MLPISRRAAGNRPFASSDAFPLLINGTGFQACLHQSCRKLGNFDFLAVEAFLTAETSHADVTVIEKNNLGDVSNFALNQGKNFGMVF